MADWVGWHAQYEDPDSPLSQRLAVVRQLVEQTVAARAGAPLQVLSLCAGDGRDVLSVLERWKGRADIAARLIELDPHLAASARTAAAAAGLTSVDVVVGDAALTDNYAGAVPADLVLAAGVFGNISDEDVEQTIRALSAMCRMGGVVIWTRHRFAFDLSEDIRGWLREAGFEERAFVLPAGGEYAVGMHELAVPSPALVAGRSLFTFIER